MVKVKSISHFRLHSIPFYLRSEGLAQVNIQMPDAMRRCQMSQCLSSLDIRRLESHLCEAAC